MSILFFSDLIFNKLRKEKIDHKVSSRTLRIDFHIIFFDNGLHKTDYELLKK